MASVKASSSPTRVRSAACTTPNGSRNVSAWWLRARPAMSPIAVAPNRIAASTSASCQLLSVKNIRVSLLSWQGGSTWLPQHTRPRLAGVRPGGRRGARRERLPVHQPSEQRLDRLPPRRPLRQPARLEGRQLQEGQRAGRRPARQLPCRADVRPRASIDNFIAGRPLIAEAIAGRWGHPEAGRLGNETSEGALTWNVFRSLQEAGRLHVAAQALAATEIDAEPELGFWARRIEQAQAEPWAALQGGPDACLQVPGWGWVLIDARFGGGVDTLGDAAAAESWIEEYSIAAAGPLRR